MTLPASQPTAEDAPVTQVGPYQLTRDDDGDWFLIYLEDNEDLDSWDELLLAVPEFGHAHSVGHAILEINDTVRVVAEHWAVPPVRAVTADEG